MTGIKDFDKGSFANAALSAAKDADLLPLMRLKRSFFPPSHQVTSALTLRLVGRAGRRPLSWKEALPAPLASSLDGDLHKLSSSISL